MKLTKRIGRALAPVIGKWYLRLVLFTSRIEYIGEEYLRNLEKQEQPFIAAFWHSRLGILAGLRCEKPIYVMISRHGDGEMIARIAQAFNKPSVRGSTTRGGSAALRELAEKMKQGFDAAITPDGPKGPAEICQPGVIALAKMTDCPILPASCSAAKRRHLGSWDRFMLPYPFNRIAIYIGPPIQVPKDADDQVMEEKRLELENRLRQLTKEADRQFSTHLQ